jgi:hypothetical protein
MKVIDRNDILEINGFKKALVIKDFLIVVNCLFGSRDGKLLLFEINEKMSVKTLPHVALRCTTRKVKRIRIIYENEIFINKERVWRRLILALEIFTEIHRGLSSVS